MRYFFILVVPPFALYMCIDQIWGGEIHWLARVVIISTLVVLADYAAGIGRKAKKQNPPIQPLRLNERDEEEEEK